MKKVLLLTSVLLAILINKGFSQCNLWAKNFGGVLSEDVSGMEVDNLGNVYLCGTFQGTTSIGAYTFTSSGDKDIFITKFDSLGNVLWAKSAGGVYADEVTDIVIDSLGNAYITGNFNSTATFEGTILNSEGGIDIYIVKYSTTGSLLWANSAGSTSNSDKSASLAIFNNNVYITGNVSSNSNFSGQTLAASGTFIAKYNLDGVIQNVINALKPYNSIYNLSDLKFDNLGNLYLLGFFEYNFIIGTDTINSIGNTDNILIKYDNNLNYIWANSSGGSGWDDSKSLFIDENNDIYICGKFANSASFADTILNSFGGDDGYIAKYSNSGDFLWAVNSGTTSSNDYFYTLTGDNLENIYVVGYYNSFIWNFGTYVYTTTSYNRGIVKYNQNGQFIEVVQPGSVISKVNYSSGNFYISGSIAGQTKIGMITLITNGSNDIALARFSNFSELERFTPEICMVSVNSNNNCRIAWEEPATTRIASYKVFKKDVIGDYNLVATVPYGTGYFVDNTSNPVQKTQNYRLSILDVCGNETSLSYDHETMHLVIFQNPDDDWSLMWSRYEGVDYNYYKIYRGTTPATMALIDSISDDNGSYTDINAPTGYVYYQIEVATDITCSMAKSTTSLRSNIAYYGPAPGSTSVEENDFSQNVSVFPNPNNGKFYISLNGFYEKNTIVKIYDYKGSLIDERSFGDSSNKNFNQFDISNYSNGIYVVNVITNNNVFIKKIIKN